jgi:putative addiction module antidote
MAVIVKLKVRTVGRSTTVVLPKELLRRLKVKRDRELFAVETDDGYLLTLHDPGVEKQLKVGRKFIGKHRETFRALAK